MLVSKMLLLALATCHLLAATLVLGARRTGYSHVRDTISELGARGTHGAALATWGVFLPVGAALAFVAACSPATDARALALCIAVGYLGSALFPCDPGAPLLGTWRQQLHSIAAAIEYGGGAAVLLLRSGNAASPGSGVAALIVALGALAICLPRLQPVRGALQRSVELTLFAALTIAVARP